MFCKFVTNRILAFPEETGELSLALSEPYSKFEKLHPCSIEQPNRCTRTLRLTKRGI
jgi:hypothetical protein